MTLGTIEMTEHMFGQGEAPAAAHPVARALALVRRVAARERYQVHTVTWEDEAAAIVADLDAHCGTSR